MDVDLLTMVVLQSGIGTAGVEMSETLVKSGRSGILNTAYDFSCAFVDRNFSTLSTSGGGLPFHLNSIDMVPRAVAAKYAGDMREGDIFACNDSYMGNTHCADITMVSPVAVDDQIVGYCCVRAHMADIGFPTPTTYDRQCRDYYAEGITLPGVRVQQNFRDIPEVVEILKANIRSPEMFYGDYLAIVAALRVGQKRVADLCRKYGVETFNRFSEQLQHYGERMAREAIRDLPGGTVTKQLMYEPLPDIGYPDGFPVRATVTVDPIAEKVLIDVRDNEDNIPMGLNLSEGVLLACARQAVFAALGPEVPRVNGAFSRVEVTARTGAAVGIPRFPAATSVGGVGLTQVLYNVISIALTEMGQNVYALSGTNVGIGAAGSVVSGYDSRIGKSYVNQILYGHWGGPALNGHDGYLTFGSASSAGFLMHMSVEIGERQQPIVIQSLGVNQDSGGAGQFDGAPGSHTVITPLADPVRFIANAGGRVFPPPGTRGGQPGGSCWTWVEDADGRREALAVDADFILRPGQRLIATSCGGGGWGDPKSRDPERIRKRVEDGWLSVEKARDVYGVALSAERYSGRYAVDHNETARLRETSTMAA
ncbi:MAG: hydantoinase B/oxoprolinase family protein [Rhizobiaceae bacterium]